MLRAAVTKLIWIIGRFETNHLNQLNYRQLKNGGLRFRLCFAQAAEAG